MLVLDFLRIVSMTLFPEGLPLADFFSIDISLSHCLLQAIVEFAITVFSCFSTSVLLLTWTTTYLLFACKKCCADNAPQQNKNTRT